MNIISSGIINFSYYNQSTVSLLLRFPGPLLHPAIVKIGSGEFNDKIRVVRWQIRPSQPKSVAWCRKVVYSVQKCTICFEKLQFSAIYVFQIWCLCRVEFYRKNWVFWHLSCQKCRIMRRLWFWRKCGNFYRYIHIRYFIKLSKWEKLCTRFFTIRKSGQISTSLNGILSLFGQTEVVKTNF